MLCIQYTIYFLKMQCGNILIFLNIYSKCEIYVDYARIL